MVSVCSRLTCGALSLKYQLFSSLSNFPISFCGFWFKENIFAIWEKPGILGLYHWDIVIVIKLDTNVCQHSGEQLDKENLDDVIQS